MKRSKSIILVLVLLFALVPFKVNAEEVNSNEVKIEEQLYFDFMELKVPGDNIPEKFFEDSFKDGNANASSQGFKENFRSEKIGFSFYNYENEGDINFQIGRDRSKQGEFLNFYYLETKPDSLTQKGMDEFYKATYLTLVKEYNINENLAKEKYTVAINELKGKRNSNVTYTDGVYEITMVAMYKKEGSNILFSLKDTSNKGFDINKLRENLEGKLGPSNNAQAYYIFTKEGRDPISAEYIIPTDREWETINVRKVLNVRRDNESVKYTSDFTSSISDPLKENAPNVEYDFVTYVNSNSTVPRVREYDGYKLQIEQSLKEREKIIVVVEYFAPLTKNEEE